MFGGVSVSVADSALEIFSVINYTHHALFSPEFSISRKPTIITLSRRKQQNRIVAASTLTDNGGISLDEEFEFKRSFDEYLKAMESIRIDRDNGDNHRNSSYLKIKKKKSDKKIVRKEDRSNGMTAVKENSRKGAFLSDKSARVRENLRENGYVDAITLEKVKKKLAPREDRSNVMTAVKENSRKGDFFADRSARVREDLRENGFVDAITSEKVKKKQNKNLNRKTPNGERSDSSWRESLDFERDAFKSLYEGDVIDKPKISRLDMEERIITLSKCLNGADIDMPEWKFSRMMRSGQIKFSDYSILRVVQILGKLGNWRRVLQVIEWIQSRERYKSHKLRNIYTAALDALGKARRPVEAFNLFCRMQEQMSTYPDIVAYHCIAVTLGQAGHMKELFYVIDAMKSHPKKKFKTDLIGKWDPRLEPDVIVYNAVLNACVRRKKWEGAFWVLQQLNQQGQQPSNTTYGLVMEVMLACDKYKLVHDFFRKMQKSHIPNALVYKVLVNTFWREGKTDEAVMAVNEMENRGIVGNAGLYYDLARCLCSDGRCREAIQQIEKICKVANKPLVVTYTGLIQACLEAGDIKNGAYIFSHMQKFCSPNLVTYNIMLKAFLDHEMFEEAKQLFLRLLENGKSISHDKDNNFRVMPDIYSFNTMLDACVVNQKWDDLEFVYGKMLRYGHHFNVKRHLRLILDARRAGREGLLEMTWEHLIESERIPPPHLIREILCWRLEQGDIAAALSYCTRFGHVESQLFSRKSWLKFFNENAGKFKEGTVDGLLREGSILLAGNENLALEHLLKSCKEYLETN